MILQKSFEYADSLFLLLILKTVLLFFQDSVMNKEKKEQQLFETHKQKKLAKMIVFTVTFDLCSQCAESGAATTTFQRLTL